MADEEEYYEEEVIEDEEEWEEEIIEEYVDEDGNIVEVAPGEEVLVEGMANTAISQPPIDQRQPDVPYQAPAKPSLPAPVGQAVAPKLKTVPAAPKQENLSQEEINRRKDEEALQARRAKTREAELARTKQNQEAKAAREAAAPADTAKKGGFFSKFGKNKAEPAPAPAPAQKTITVPFTGRSTKPVTSAEKPQQATYAVPFSGQSKPVTAADQSAPPAGKVEANSAGVAARKAELKNSGLATTVQTRRKQKTAKIVTETREKFSKKTGEITRTTIRYITEPDGTKRTETTTETIKKGA
jgi:hypothetical protein